MNHLFAYVVFIFPAYFLLVSGQRCAVTITTTEGPYYKAGAPMRANLAICDFEKNVNGTSLRVYGRVYNSGCKKGVQALLDVWSANPQGQYSNKYGPDYTCRGKLQTDVNGNYEFFTTLPGHYEMSGSFRPAHIHYKVGRIGNPTKVLTTQQYFENDPYFKTDPCHRNCFAGNPTITVPIQKVTNTQGQSFMIKFDIVLGPAY